MSTLTDLFNVSDLRVLITGGGSGLGLMMAKAFAKNGASVTVVGRSESKLASAKIAIKALAPDAKLHTISVDLASQEAVARILSALSAAEQGEARLDVLINCAGMSRPDGPSNDHTPIAELQATMAASDPAAWSSTFMTNVQAPYALTVGLLHLLAASPTNGRVINISSIGALMTDPNVHQPAYQVSKAALDHLTRILASKFRQIGVRVNGIAPGYFPSAMNDPKNPKSMVSRSDELVPLKRAGREDDIAGTAIWLASPAGSYIDGQVIVVDGGRSWAWVQMK